MAAGGQGAALPREYATWDQLRWGVDRRTNERHTFIIERAKAHVITLDETHFVASSALVQPAPASEPPKKLSEPYFTGTGILAQAIRHAGEHADHKLLIAAHVPAFAGQDGKLGRSAAVRAAEQRAALVHALLKGDRGAFVGACAMLSGGDLARLLIWAARAHGYPCAPAGGTGCTPAAQRDALRGFRAHHAEQSGGAEPGGEPNPTDDDFAAFYQLYERSLARALAVEPDALSGERAKLKFTSPPTLGCGDFHRGPGGQSRVELLFFEPSPAPPHFERDILPGTSIYRDDRYVKRTPLEVTPDPIAICVRMSGMFFDTNKCFLLRSALRGMRSLIKLYNEHPDGELLIVGHTDTRGEPDYNLQLSLDRARAVAAYLTDDVDAWLVWYEESVPAKQRWGGAEDSVMLDQVAGPAQAGTSRSARIKSYQSERGLDADGIIGPNTRRQLVTDYMAADATTLPAGIAPVVHGCGEHFPALQTGDDQEEAQNRRVELYLFSGKVEPAPPGETSSEGSGEYARWRERTVREVPFEATDPNVIDITIELPLVDGHEPVGGARYRVTCEDETLEGSTDAAGKLQLPSSVITGALLEVWVDGDDAPPISWELTVDELPGPDDPEGARARLENLALADEAGEGGEFDPLDEGLLAFQSRHDVEDPDPFGPITQDALLEVYGA